MGLSWSPAVRLERFQALRLGKKLGYALLRWAALLAALPLCLIVLSRQGPGLPWAETILLAGLRLILLFRTVVLQRDAQGRPALLHRQGEAFVVIALLRHGPAEALAVSLLSGAVYYALYRAPGKRHLLVRFSDMFFTAAVTWTGGSLYFLLGGHSVRTVADSALFYQHPTAIFLPLLAMLFFVNDLVHRGFLSLLLYVHSGTPFRETWRDPFFTVFDHVEGICAALLVVQWTAWGWGTVPFTLLLNESLLLATRSHFERLAARREADFDPLTGLASWRGIETHLGGRIMEAEKSRASFALLFLDADGLKRVNDRYGHKAGDALLTLIGDCCRLHARKSDLAGRRGGDEYLLVLDGLDRPGAEKVKERLQQAITDTLAVHPQFAGMAGASIGLAMFPQDADEKEALIAFADGEMYRDKQARRTAPAT